MWQEHHSFVRDFPGAHLPVCQQNYWILDLLSVKCYRLSILTGAVPREKSHRLHQGQH